ncbi:MULTISPECIES: hypothetical protein [unclassified Acinetobacter]|uniref:hypothetical protein n=1 Tax=unclassified Acinetobacter TaxID=196816 RepID=UPI0018AC24D2|nr:MULTISPECIES: hypothetical protein [unclassified Acinetobacter]MBJ9953673.1 hypothetical protein [Acinetobacter baumannii]
MLKLIIVLLILITLYVLWRLVAKHKINAAFEQQRQELSRLIKNPSEENDLPEKTKLIKQMIDEERQKTSTVLATPLDVQEAHPPSITELERVEESQITDEDQRLFDAAAQLFFEQALQTKDFSQAGHIQHEVLSKMPMNTQSQVGSFDFGEWSIFWNYHDQSLEYYVGRYGVFYAHVDHQGIEHKAEFKDRY